MVTLAKSGNAIVFTFDDNDHYLNDGTIEVPVNSLTLVTDESQMATFKKSATNDIFISATYNELGMSKADLESWFKENACGSTGGGSGSGVTSGEVQTMIDESISGKADSSRVDTIEEVTARALVDLDEKKADTSAVTTSINAAVSGKQDTLSAGTNITISGNVISAEGGGKAIEAGRGIAITTGATADTVSFDLPISAGTGNGAVVIGSNGHEDNANYKSEANQVGAVAFASRYLYSKNIAKQESSFAHGTGCVASGNSSHAEGFGTIANDNSHSEGESTIARGSACHAEGVHTLAANHYSVTGAHAEGYSTSAITNYSHTEGYYTKTSNQSEHASGEYNATTSGASTSAQTLFSVGNGTANNARHNAFEIRKNGDIYITKDGADIKLQDNLGGGLPESAFTTYTAATEVRLAEDEEVTAAALNSLNDATAANTTALGGLKLVSLTQAQYDALVTKDANTLYVITGSN